MEVDVPLHLDSKCTTMADISNQDPTRSEGKVRVKKSSTKIDMTPMVDLAFLLLTFFILTTTFNKSRILVLTMPDKVTIPDQAPMISGKDVLNLVVGENHKLYWWVGLDGVVHRTDYSASGLRKILRESLGQNPKIMVLIKPMDKSKFQDMVDILDEIHITNMPRYAIVEFTVRDRHRLKDMQAYR